MKKQRIIAFGAVALFLWIPCLVAQEISDDSAVEKAARGLLGIAATLSEAGTYEFKADVTVTRSAELLNFLSEDERNSPSIKYQLRGRYSGDHGLLERKKVTPEGGVMPYMEYYITAENVIVREANGAGATVVSLSDKDSAGLPPNVDAPLLILGFLQPHFDQNGVRAITRDLFSSPKAWEQVIETLKASGVGDGEKPTLSFKKGDVNVSVVFSFSPDGSKLWPSELTVRSAKDEALITVVKVIEFFQDPGTQGIARRLVMEAYVPHPGKPGSFLGATWDFDVKQSLVGGTVLEDELEFDAASVDAIWDSGVRVVVPR